VDPENEDSARLLLNLQDDAAIAIAKIITDFEDDVVDEEAALEEIEGVREIVLAEVDIDDEEKVMLIDGVQTSPGLCLLRRRGVRRRRPRRRGDRRRVRPGRRRRRGRRGP